MAVKKTHETFLEEFKNKYGNEFIVLDTYINSRTPIKIKHNICNRIFSVKPNNILYEKHNCPLCYRDEQVKIFKSPNFKNSGQRKNFEKLIEDLSMNNDKYKIIDKYIDFEKSIKFSHTNEENTHIFEMSPKKFIKYQKCPICFPEIYKKTSKNKLTHEEFEKRFFNIFNKEEYMILSQYDTLSKKIKIKHLFCGHEYEASGYNLLNNKTKCPNCNRCDRNMLTTEEFKKRLFNIWGSKIKLLDEYKGTGVKIEFECENNHKFKSQPRSILQGYGCPDCALIYNSKAETKINEYFELNKISFKRNFKNSNCKDINILPFDFCVFTPLNIYIEYDGEQHFIPRRNSNGIEKYITTIKHDQIKDNFCSKHRIPLLRIPYTEFKNLEFYLEKILEFISKNISFSYEEFLDFKNSLNIIYPEKTPIENLKNKLKR